MKNVLTLFARHWKNVSVSTGYRLCLSRDLASIFMHEAQHINETVSHKSDVKEQTGMLMTLLSAMEINSDNIEDLLPVPLDTEEEMEALCKTVKAQHKS